MVRLRNRAMTSSPPLQERQAKNGRFEKNQRVVRKVPPKRPPLSTEIRNIRGGNGSDSPTDITNTNNSYATHNTGNYSSSINGNISPELTHTNRTNRPIQPITRRKPARPPPPMRRGNIALDGPVFSHPRLQQYSNPNQQNRQTALVPDTIHPPRSRGVDGDRSLPPWIDNAKRRRAPPPPVAFNHSRIAKLLAQKKRAPPPPTIMEVSSGSTSPLSSRAASPGPSEGRSQDQEEEEEEEKQVHENEPPVDYENEEELRDGSERTSPLTPNGITYASLYPITGDEYIKRSLPESALEEQKGIVEDEPIYSVPNKNEKRQATLHESLLREIKQAAEERSQRQVDVKEPDKYMSPHNKMLTEMMSVFKQRQERRASGSLIMRDDTGRGSKTYRAKEKDSKEKINEGFTSAMATGRPNSTQSNSIGNHQVIPPADEASSVEEDSLQDEDMKVIELEAEDDLDEESWSPEQDLPNDEAERYDKAITARGVNEPTFFHIFTDISSDSESPKKKMKMKRSSLKKIQHSMKTMLGSLGRTFAKKNKLREFVEGNWEIYHTQEYDDAPDGPISVHHIEKRPVYAYSPSKDRLMLIPDYERVIITQDGLVIRESAVTKVHRPFKKERMTTKQVKEKGVPVPVEDIRKRESQMEHERSVQEAIEKQIQEVRSRKNGSTRGKTVIENGIRNEKPGRQMISNFTPMPPSFSGTASSRGSFLRSHNSRPKSEMMYPSERKVSPTSSLSDYAETDGGGPSFSTLRPMNQLEDAQDKNGTNSDIKGALYLRERMRLQRHTKGSENPLYTSEGEGSSDEEDFPKVTKGVVANTRNPKEGCRDYRKGERIADQKILPVFLPATVPFGVPAYPGQQIIPAETLPPSPNQLNSSLESSTHAIHSPPENQMADDDIFDPYYSEPTANIPSVKDYASKPVNDRSGVFNSDDWRRSIEDQVEIEDIGSDSDEDMLSQSDTPTSPSPIPLNLIGESSLNLQENEQYDPSQVSLNERHPGHKIDSKEFPTDLNNTNEPTGNDKNESQMFSVSENPVPPSVPQPPPPPPLPPLPQSQSSTVLSPLTYPSQQMTDVSPNSHANQAANIPVPPPLPPLGFKPKSPQPSSPTTQARTTASTTPPKSPSNLISPPSPHDSLMDELRKRLRGGAPQPFGAEVSKSFRPINFNPSKSPEVPPKPGRRNAASDGNQTVLVTEE